MAKLFGISALMLALAIGFGAFAAHGLKERLDAYHILVFEKAAYYHLTQSLGLLLILLLPQSHLISFEVIKVIFFILLFGIIVFSGSLYLLAVTDVKWLGAITPIGGAAMIIAWTWLGIKLLFS